MKNLFITSIFTLIVSLTFAQNNPQIVFEQSNKGYDVALKMDDVSNISSVKVEGNMKQGNFTEEINLDLNVTDIKNQVAFKSFGFENVQAEFIIVVTDKDGNEMRYPSIDLNLVKDDLVSQKF